jgi:hypothetical protein
MATTEATGRAGRVRVEQGAKRVRAYLGGELVADTIRPRLVWEVPYYPAYYVPLADVRDRPARRDRHRHPLPQPRRPAGRAGPFPARLAGAQAGHSPV